MMHEDITERKLRESEERFRSLVETTERKLRESEERFRSLVETTSDLIWEVDANSVYTYVSPKIKDILGYEPEEIIGKSPFDLMPSDEAKRVGKIFQAAVESKKSLTWLENTNLHKDGRLIVLETSGEPILNEDGALLGYRGIDRDITERKKAEQKLKELIILTPIDS
jgi:PAS domain S-box-containing protein